MNDDHFEVRLRELEAMAGTDAGMDIFNQEYESLLNEIKAMPGPKFEKLKRMQKLVYRQFMFLFGEWRRTKAIDAMQGSGQEPIRERMN